MTKEELVSVHRNEVESLRQSISIRDKEIESLKAEIKECQLEYAKVADLNQSLKAELKEIKMIQKKLDV